MKKYIIFALVTITLSVAIASAQNYTFSNNLTVGSSGTDVANLQSWLISNGYDIPAVSSGAAAKGYFGSQTKTALINFQRAISFPAFGFFGPMTRERLNQGGITVGNDLLGVTYPNGGESISAGGTYNITWRIYNASFASSTVSISMENDSIHCGYMVVGCWTSFGIASGLKNTGSYSWDTGMKMFGDGGPNSVPVAPGSEYKIKVCIDGTQTCDDSDNYFSISSSSSPVAGPLKITSPNGGEVWQKGTTQTITWTSPYYFRATSADLKITQNYVCTTQVCPAIAYAPNTIATNIPINQNSYSWNVGTIVPISATGYGIINGTTLPVGQYTVQICETGTSNCDSSDGVFNIVQ
jgi:hypothetical protein